MLATAWGLGIANPQSIKRLGHFLTADCKSAGTPNGGQDISSATEKDISGATETGISGAGGISSATDRGICNPLSHRYAGNSLVAGDCKSPEHKEVRTFFDGG